ncbi:hypothetical protein [Mycobacteroides abscessus]|uniref:hypothetical protein n=1 Tax=Mycobacteroides abscessus TaxID=36809 RepID=UPI0009C65CAD|nr:hypothetical protein [Mycobacteroides abscessus]SLF57514.1 Uncharacterised protein [Mycobacteroides abscessus subsp. abscessus]
MKTEWTGEPYTTVRWALFEAMRAADNASVENYWDVVTDNLIRGLGLHQERAIEYPTLRPGEPVPIIRPDEEVICIPDRGDFFVSRLVSDWKRVDSNE